VAVEFLILGSLEIRHEGRPLELGGARRRGLIAALLLAESRVVAADALIEALWGENGGSGASNALQTQVSRVRRDLGSLSSRPDD
jgi:DNA-binding SARP family transcriptional activator